MTISLDNKKPTAATVAVVGLTTLLLALSSFVVDTVSAQETQCLSDPEKDAVFATDNPTCCQNDVCLIPCPEPVTEPTKGKLYESVSFDCKENVESNLSLSLSLSACVCVCVCVFLCVQCYLLPFFRSALCVVF